MPFAGQAISRHVQASTTAVWEGAAPLIFAIGSRFWQWPDDLRDWRLEGADEKPHEDLSMLKAM
jgi:hypothetical protein